MRKKDIERLKEICEKEGFEIRTFIMDNSKFEITKKDLWDGVEFVEAIKANTISSIFNGIIYPVESIVSDTIRLKNGLGSWKTVFKPSTEHAYFEQLKKEAFERFGEIKDGDRFQFENSDIRDIKLSDSPDFDYAIESDELSLWGFSLYKSGKWAKKIEKLKIEPYGGSISMMAFYFKWGENEFKAMKRIGLARINEYLAKCLEDKLNEQ